MPDDEAAKRAARLVRLGAASTALALLSDDEFAARIEAAGTLGSGIGGTHTRLDADGVPVFVKRVPLTDLERRPEHVRSTANLFGLPAHCQYGVASPGFGAWRELAAHIMTTDLEVAGRGGRFPLLYHWRVVPGAVPVPADVEQELAYWGDMPEVRARVEARAGASASLVLCLEHVPHQLGQWLAGPLRDGGDGLVAACAMMERDLLGTVDVLRSSWAWHFDTHLGNLLTDGRRVYLGDFGLATSQRFALSAPERDFLRRNATHDAGYARMVLVNWLVHRVVGVPVPAGGGPVERNAYVRECAKGMRPDGVPPEIADMIVRHAPVAAVMNDFYWALFGGALTTAYPTRAVDSALAATALAAATAAGRNS